MLHTHHQTRGYVTAVEAERLERMVVAARRGDQSAWSALVARFRNQILRVARAYGLNTHEADDVAQETWLRLYRSIERVRDPRAIAGWVDTTARRESLRALALGRLETVTDEEIGVEADLPDDPDDDLMQERRVALAGALSKLPAKQRKLIESLLEESEPSYADIAGRLGVPIGSIGPTRGRCIERLRGLLAPELNGGRR